MLGHCKAGFLNLYKHLTELYWKSSFFLKFWRGQDFWRHHSKHCRHLRCCIEHQAIKNEGKSDYFGKNICVSLSCKYIHDFKWNITFATYSLILVMIIFYKEKFTSINRILVININWAGYISWWNVKFRFSAKPDFQYRGKRSFKQCRTEKVSPIIVIP